MKSVLKTSFFNALGVLFYISLVSLVISNGDKLFGEMESILGPIAFLLLFTLSALVVGSLLIGKPMMLYIDNKKKEAISMIIASISWLVVFFVFALAISALI